MILITGASGNIGRELCKLLAQANIKARAMCRTKGELAQFINIGLEAVVGDLEDPDSLRQAMQGCERMFLLAAAVPEQAQHYMAAIDMAVETGITHIVKISTGDSNLGSHIAWAKASAESDHYLRSKPLDWTILRATGFMLNLLESKATIAEGFLPNPSEDGNVAWLDHRDIALVARHVLTEDTHNRATYFLTGPEALTSEDVARKLTEVLGFRVNSVPVSMDDMRNDLVKVGLDEWHIRSFMAQYEMVKGKYLVDVTEDIKRITGREARTFTQFIQEFKAEFTGRRNER